MGNNFCIVYLKIFATKMQYSNLSFVKSVIFRIFGTKIRNLTSFEAKIPLIEATNGA